jgi:hypothetical protein
VRRRIREVLRDLGAKGRRETRRLGEEFDQLRRDHTELKSRLAKIEERTSKDGAPRAAKKAASPASKRPAKKRATRR